MSDLQQDADTVTDLARRILACPVLKLLDDVQRIIQYAIVRMSVNIYNGPDSAGILLILKSRIQTSVIGLFSVPQVPSSCRIM